MAKIGRILAVAAGLVALGGGLAYSALLKSIAPLPAGESRFVRFSEGESLESSLAKLEAEGFIRSAKGLGTYARLRRKTVTVKTGTYEFNPGMDADAILAALRKPIRAMVRIPEGWWIARVAKRLEEKQVCSAEEYIALANKPGEFKDVVEFELPKDSLEGYLYPDTYDLPPLTPARDVIEIQLRTFEKKVKPVLPETADIKRVLTVASMVELEAGVDEERAKVAGVIENRLRAGQRLELDATVLYGLQEWKSLGPGEVRKVKSPYNTYLHGGLPPGPIGSPSLKSIEGALAPETHPFFFYVARPNRTHYFTRTYPEHIAAIRKARAEWKEAEQAK